MKYFFKILSIILGTSLIASCERVPEKAPVDMTILQEQFQNPPNEARPRVWWHWMNGNISKQGIRKDLEWMHRTGIGGFQNFDANLFTPVVVPRKLVFMDPEWKDAFKFTTELADSLGLEMAIAGSPGWSVTGGPWVEPRDGMKKYVWSELILKGGQTFDGRLPEPPHTTGAFQNTKVPSEGIAQNESEALPEYYHDAAVVAFKLPEQATDLHPRVTSSAGHFNIAMLTDSDLEASIYLPPAAVGENMWIQYEFNTPRTFRSYAVTGAYHNSLEQFRGSPDNRALLVSDDGLNFRKVSDIPGTLVPQTTGSFPETTAKYWRFAIETLPPGPRGFSAMFGAPAPTDPDGIEVAEFNLFATPRINLFEQKAGFAAWRENPLPEEDSGTTGVALENVIDLTEKCDENGNLKWTVPEGSWKIIRLGYSLTGRQNHPASPEATGLEVDKLDEDAVRRYINTYLDMYKDATGGRMGAEGLGYVILDSYEAGHMNWTHDMVSEFSVRRGYDMKPWVPVLAGYVVMDVQQSEKFLWDFRKTIGEMIAENHYDVIGEELHKRGMKRYTESHEGGRIYLADGMDVKRNADIPMSAMWTPGSLAGGTDEEVRSEADIRESASVANIYGQPYVAAESMTSIMNAFSWHPEKLKRTADMELASGLNRYVIHTSVHQPLDDKMPGFSLGPFGQYFTRQETWSGAGAKSWIDYLSRSSLMMQQGRNIADILYYYGENNNITQLYTQSLPVVPAGYEYDFANASALENALTVKAGKLKANSGNTYQLLVLDESAREMTIEVLKKISELVNAGAKLYGAKPAYSPSLGDDPEAFKALADKTWANPNVLHGSMKEALAQLQVSPDVVFGKSATEIRFRHRKTEALDIYWLDNRSADPATATVSFRISGKKPELWNPQTGETMEVGYEIEGDRTILNLNFEYWGAYFIVFGEETDTDRLVLPEKREEMLTTFTGPWEVSFQKARGAPAGATFDSLVSWTERDDPGIKYFSGTATYRTAFEAPESPPGSTLILDLGSVKNIAEVSLNGKPLGTVWKQPFRVPVGAALEAGKNTLEIKVTNVWVNRLIGDTQPEVKDKITFSTMPFYSADATLVPSGLLGPVEIILEHVKN